MFLKNCVITQTGGVTYENNMKFKWEMVKNDAMQQKWKSITGDRGN